MSLTLLAKRAGPRLALLQTRSVSTTQPASAGYWNKDWRPADNPPTTEEGRRAAAKKYGMIPEDYECYDNDGTGYGDYPKLPLVSAESRDPHALYDYPELKRNFGEPMNVDFDLVGEDRWHYNERLRVPLWKMWAWFLTVVGTAGVLCFTVDKWVRVVPTPMMPRQLPNSGKKNYSFELEDA